MGNLVLLMFTLSFVLLRCEAIPLENSLAEIITPLIDSERNATLVKRQETSNITTPKSNNGTDDATRNTSSVTPTRLISNGTISTRLTDHATRNGTTPPRLTHDVTRNGTTTSRLTDDATRNGTRPSRLTDDAIRNGTTPTPLTDGVVRNITSLESTIATSPVKPETTSEMTTERGLTGTQNSTSDTYLKNNGTGDSITDSGGETLEWSSGKITGVVLGTIAAVAILAALGKFALAKFK